MNSALFRGQVFHCRMKPTVHRFQYPVFGCLLDLDELPQLEREVRFFGYNNFNLLSIHDSDYFPGADGSIKQKLLDHLRNDSANPQARAVAEEILRVELISTPRQVTSIFNPVSFYRCYNQHNEICCIVAEVNNTFGETHLYTLLQPMPGGSPRIVRYQWCKEFHVSPFNDMNGEYRFYFSQRGNFLDFRVHILREGKAVFVSRLFGSTDPFTSGNLLRLAASYPVTAHLAMPRITWEAAKLYFGKGLRVYTRPIASSSMTIRSRPRSMAQDFCCRMVENFLARLSTGCLTLTFPDGSEKSFGDLNSSLHGQILVKNYDFFAKSIFFGDIGFGESYVDGHWDTDDLGSVLGILAANVETAGDRAILLSYLGRAVNKMFHFRHRNSKRGSLANISAHYDLSNDFFARFLDSTMTYSSALYLKDDDTLEQAQVNKLRAMISKARICASDHVLEIGSGWGSFALQAVRDTGCRITTITLSNEQKNYVEQRVAAAGLQDKIKVLLCDYREMQGSFDKIVSIEMLEAVGHHYYGQFFSACDRLLKKDGIIALQVITIPDQRYNAYRRGCDWIQKYIFPGGLCPSISVVADSLKSHSRLMIEEVENIALHYARTLQQWRENFVQQSAELKEMGFDERFQRLWGYYLWYCEAGFSARVLGTHQLVLTRPGNSKLAPCPGYLSLGQLSSGPSLADSSKS